MNHAALAFRPVGEKLAWAWSQMRRRAAQSSSNGGGLEGEREAGAADFDGFTLPSGLHVRPLGKTAAVAAHTFGPVGNPASAAVPLVDAQQAMNAFLPQRPPSPMPGSGLGMIPPAMAGTSVTGGGDQLPGNSAIKSTIQTKGPISATGDFGNPNAGQDVTKMASLRRRARIKRAFGLGSLFGRKSPAAAAPQVQSPLTSKALQEAFGRDAHNSAIPWHGKDKPYREADVFNHGGWDDLDYIESIMELEERLGVDANDDDLMDDKGQYKVRTLGALEDYFAQRPPRGPSVMTHARQPGPAVSDDEAAYWRKAFGDDPATAAERAQFENEGWQYGPGAAAVKAAVSRATARPTVADWLYDAVQTKAAGEAGCTARHSQPAFLRLFNQQLRQALGQEKRAELGRMSQLFGREFVAGEDCAHCGVKFERGDAGQCNRCGRNYDTGKPWSKEKKANVFQDKVKHRLIKDTGRSSDTGEAPRLAEERRVFEAMRAHRPNALSRTEVHVGHSDPARILQRMQENPRLGAAGRRVVNDEARYADFLYAPADRESRMQDEIDGPSYNSYADVAIAPWRAPGTTVHELGHAIDFNGDKPLPEGGITRWLAQRKHDMYRNSRNWVPGMELWQEHAAWRKGQEALQHGAARQGWKEKELQPVLHNIANNRGTGLGSYWRAAAQGAGSVLGGGLGLAGGIAGAIALNNMASQNNMRLGPRLLGTVGIAPAMAGAGLGGYAGGRLADAVGLGRENPEKNRQKMDDWLANEYPKLLAQYRSLQPQMRKAANGDMLAFKAWKATGLSNEEADRKAGESLALPIGKIDWGKRLKRLKERREIPGEKAA